MRLHRLLPLLVAAIPAFCGVIRDVKHIAARSDSDAREDQETFDEDTAGFRERGLCRYYMGLPLEEGVNKSLETCDKWCGKLIGDGGSQTEVSCRSMVEPESDGSDGAEVDIDPDGNQFKVGQCLCGDLPLVNNITDAVMEALPAIAQIGCELIMDSLELVTELALDAIPEVGPEASAGMRAAVKAAKTIEENGGDASELLSWLNPCGTSQYTDQIDSIFDKLNGVPGEEGSGCFPGNKKCKNGSKGGGGGGSGGSKDTPAPTKSAPNAASKSNDASKTRTTTPASTTASHTPSSASPTSKVSTSQAATTSGTTASKASSTSVSKSTSIPSSTPSSTSKSSSISSTSSADKAFSTTAIDICSSNARYCQDDDDIEDRIVPDLGVLDSLDSVASNDSSPTSTEAPTPSSSAGLASGALEPQTGNGTWHLSKRGNKRRLTVFGDKKGGGRSIISKAYPSRGQLFQGRNGAQVIKRLYAFATNNIKDFKVNSQAVPGNLPQGHNKPVTEHIIELQTIPRFMEAAVSGKLPSNKKAKTATISKAYFEGAWSQSSIKTNLPLIGKGNQSPNKPIDRVMEALGSSNNRADFVLCDHDINAVKAVLWAFKSPIAIEDFNEKVEDALDPRQKTILSNDFLSHIRTAIGVFGYLDNKDVNSRMKDTLANIRKELVNIENNTTGGTGLADMWDEYIKDHFTKLETVSQAWVAARIKYAEGLYSKEADKFKAKQQKVPQHISFTLDTLNLYKAQIPQMTVSWK